MSLNHLLPLSALHAAAPGVLDVVFRPDGDFKGAPPWAGPMTSLADTARHGWLVWRGALHVSVATADGHWSSTVEQWRERWALDLRIPTVAARLAGLCARALGCPADAAFMSDTGTPEQGFVAFRAEWALIGGRRWIWSRGTGAELSERPAGVCLPPRCDAASGLAALTLTLAPKIAALKK